MATTAVKKKTGSMKAQHVVSRVLIYAPVSYTHLILDDAEVDGLDTVGGSLRIVLLQGSDEPGAHVAHSRLAVLKGTGVMQTGGLLLSLIHI